MAPLFIVVAVAAAVLSHGTAIFAPAIVNAVLSFWSNGVLANFRREEAQDAPDWAATVSMVTTVVAIVFLVLALFVLD